MEGLLSKGPNPSRFCLSLYYVTKNMVLTIAVAETQVLTDGLDTGHWTGASQETATKH